LAPHPNKEKEYKGNGTLSLRRGGLGKKNGERSLRSWSPANMGVGAKPAQTRDKIGGEG